MTGDRSGIRGRRLAALVLTGGIIVSSVACSTTRSAGVEQRIDAYFGDLHARGLFDGAVVVSDSGGRVWAQGYGFANVERRAPFTPDTVADGASLAKTFTASLVLMLDQEGVLRLDDPVQRFLPEFPYPEITLRHLLSHTSGLPVLDYDFFDPYVPPGEIRTTEILLGVLQSERPKLVSTPGTSFEYSSFGYDLAALAAARAAKETYAQLLDERIFRPLGITTAFVRPGRLADFPGVRTLGYRRVDGNLEVHDVFEGEAFAGGSNIYISARDLDRWNRSFLEEWKPITGVSTPAHVGDAAAALTLGNWYRTDDGTAFWYSGHLQGFHDEVFRDVPSGTSIVYVSNNTVGPWLQKGIVRAVRSILRGHPQRFVDPAVVAVTRDERLSLAGAWTTPSESVAITRGDRGLFLVWRGVSYRMVQIHPTAFYTPGLDWMIGFGRNAAGAVDRIYVEDNVSAGWGRRRNS